MATQKLLSVAEIDKHVYDHSKKLGIKPDFQSGNLQAFNLCQIYTTVRPIIIFAKVLLFWRPTWQQGVTAFVAVLDAQCNITG